MANGSPCCPTLPYTECPAGGAMSVQLWCSQGFPQINHLRASPLLKETSIGSPVPSFFSHDFSFCSLTSQWAGTD